MIPASLSASSVAVYEECPARWKAEYFVKAPQLNNDHAGLGTACHEAMELFVKGGHHLQAGDHWAIMAPFYDAAYWAVFSDRSRYDEGVELCQKWLARQNWTGRTVLTTELKRRFDLPTSAGDIPFSYIMDREDQMDNGDIEVIDYKSVNRPISAEVLKERIQARAYALAAQLLHPDAKRIWVVFDLLRWEKIGVVFTKDENRATWRYLRDLAERIIADNEAPEKLTTGCRFCIRKHECETLKKHIAAGGVLSITDPEEAAQKRHELKMVLPALEAMIADLDKLLMDHADLIEEKEFFAPGVQVSVASSRKRSISPTDLAAIIGPEKVLEMGTVTVKEVDALIKGGTLTEDQVAAIKLAFKMNYSDARIDTKAVA